MPTTASATIVGGVETSLGIEAVRKLKSIDPPSYLSKSPEISEAARLASEYLFSSIKPYAPKSPFPHLLVNGFDAEQIWQQIDIQSQPLISTLRRKVQNFEKNPKEIKSWFNVSENDKSVEEKKKELDVNDKEIEDFDDEDVTNDDDEEEEDDEEDEEMEDDDEEEEQNLVDGGGEDGFEDQFLKMNELDDYMEKDEARMEKDEARETKRKKKQSRVESADEEESEEEEEEDELEAMGLEDDEDGEGLNARYKDFFGGKGKDTQKRKSKSVHVSDQLDMDKEFSDDDNNKKNEKLSTHEREQERIRSTIEEMEKANLKPKSWIMQGEVTAAKRPKNSALEVDLDFEHNVRPAPVITDEVTASLEELIHKRIVEGRFDDVQKPPTLPSRAPRELKQLDENKSEKGLGDIYAEDYVKKTGLVSVAVSMSDQQKKEAKLLFKELCLKLDALSHFHFTPKPVIEDMSIQVNVPALAMEEIAPLAVSDAAMLAPEEVFAGKGDIKEETELTQSDRKRRRAKKKRKFKANAAKMPAKPQPTPQSNIDGENEP